MGKKATPSTNGQTTLRQIGWADDELAMIQEQYSSLLDSIQFPIYIPVAHNTNDYQVVVNGKDYGFVRETTTENGKEYRAMSDNGEYFEPISGVFHNFPMGAVCELARHHHDIGLASRLDDYIIAVCNVQQLASAQLKANVKDLLGMGR